MEKEVHRVRSRQLSQITMRGSRARLGRNMETEQPEVPVPVKCAVAEPSPRMVPGIGWTCPDCGEHLRAEDLKILEAVSKGAKVGPGECPKCKGKHFIARSFLALR